MPISSFITTGDLQKFVAVTDNVSREYATQLEGWTDSPFAWILTLPSRARGAAGEKIVDKWLVANGCSVARAGHTGCDRVVNGANMEIKFSTLWKAGGYTFQQLRDQDYASVFCLGISPKDVHAWVIPKAIAWKYATPQHGGSAGKDTKWLTFSPSAPPSWIVPYGGTLAHALEVLKAQQR